MDHTPAAAAIPLIAHLNDQAARQEVDRHDVDDQVEFRVSSKTLEALKNQMGAHEIFKANGATPLSWTL